MALLDLLEKVRVEGRFRTQRNAPLDQSLPIILDADSEEGVPYLNSGGRSIVFESGGRCYRIKGVDPYGYLTRKVAISKQNKITNVMDTYRWALWLRKKNQSLLFRNSKPFGVLTKEDAMKEKVTFETLHESYVRNGIVTPCKYLSTHEFSDGNVQNLFELPSLEADFRLEEFNQLLRDRLNKCDAKELEQRTKPVFQLYHRILTWQGWDLKTLIDNGLEPHPDSWFPQNYVISQVGNGYGIFRVDHTSTVVNKEATVEKSVDSIFGGLEGIGFGTFVRVPTGIIVGINYKLSTGKNLKKNKPLFEQGYNYMGTVRGPKQGYGYFLKILGMALVAGGTMHGVPSPIPEYRFREVLE